MTAATPPASDLRAAIQLRYGGRAAAQVALDEPAAAACCGTDTSCCAPRPTGVNAFSEDLYDLETLDGVPLKAALARLGCANPTAVAELQPGQIVLDLGSGGGLDALLAARRVGPSGQVYGVDMTDEMLSLAWRNAAEAGVGNVSFLKGDIEHVPMPDACVDVVISNCVINLAADKRNVIAEAWRVLKPGGKFAVADVVIRGGLPENSPFSDALRQDLYAWGSCVAGALSDVEYLAMLTAQGFTGARVDVLRGHTASDLFPSGLPDYATLEPAETVNAILERFASAVVHADKPGGVT
ncbi:arsenite methyltransferase [Allorhizocola rhizosphaerae]|uniref:arsenite methyltransferase n=1 Tax=Allorhizocola rhizosphaerae TaxID=1872709 RepID=UPI000E3D2C1C|nr:arsenite methyltransferase [Allorhizocola rhizosphaerae]